MDDPPNYSFKLKSTHKSAIHRQITEALLIDNTPEGNLMNGKAEWGHNSIHRLKLPENQHQQGDPLPKIPAQATNNAKRVHSGNLNNFDMQFIQRKKMARLEKAKH